MTEKKLSPRTFNILSIVTGAVALCLLVFPYMFFPQFYTPKANASMGYIAPSTFEGWTFMITGLILLGVTIVIRKFFAQTAYR